MTTITSPTTDLQDSVPLAQILTSAKAIKALEAAGIRTVGDVRKKALSELASMKGIGDSALAALRGVGVPDKGEQVQTVEESEHPIELRSPYPGYRIRILRGGAIFNGPSVQVLQPVFVGFTNGEAKMTRELWLTGKHERDAKKVKDEMLKPTSEAPWRVEACEWLKQRNAYRRHDFVILFD